MQPATLNTKLAKLGDTKCVIRYTHIGKTNNSTDNPSLIAFLSIFSFLVSGTMNVHIERQYSVLVPYKVNKTPSFHVEIYSLFIKIE